MLKGYSKKIIPAHFLSIMVTGSLLLMGGISALPQVLPAQTGRIDLYFFYAEDCQPCQVILKDYLPTLKTMFPSLEVKIGRAHV